MFQYTTETIINSNKGNLPVEGELKRFGVINDEFIVVDGVNTFKIENISKVFHSPFREAVKAEATINVPTDLEAGDIVRLTITVAEEGSNRSILQNAFLHKTKPFHYECEVGDPDELANDLAKLIKKDMAESGFKLFKASVVSGDLVIDATDCYLQFVKKDTKLEKVVEPTEGTWGGYARELTEKVGTGVTIVRGDEGAGTVARLVKNLRIPTSASINPFAADQGGKPIPGGEYDQFLIEYTTERRHVAGVVVGSVDTSITSHVFFIEKGCLEDWTDMLEEAGLVVTVAGKTPADDIEDTDARLAVIDDEVVLKAKTEMGSVE